MTTSINAFFRTQLNNISHYFSNPAELCSKVASAVSNIWKQVTSGFTKATNTISFTNINLAPLSTQKLASKVNDLKNFLYVEFQNATQEPVEIEEEIWDAAVKGDLEEIKHLVPKGRNFISYGYLNNIYSRKNLYFFIKESVKNNSLEAVEFGLDGRKLGDYDLGDVLKVFLRNHKKDRNFDENTLSIIKLLLSGGRKINQVLFDQCFIILASSDAPDNYIEALEILLSDGRKPSHDKLSSFACVLSTKKNYEELFYFLSLDKITLSKLHQEYILCHLDKFKELRQQFFKDLLACLSDGLSDESYIYIGIGHLINNLKTATSEIKNNYRENIKLLLDYGSRLTLEHRGQLAIDFASMGEVDILQKLLNSGPITKEAKNKAIESDSCFNKEAVIEVLQKATISDFE